MHRLISITLWTLLQLVLRGVADLYLGQDTPPATRAIGVSHRKQLANMKCVELFYLTTARSVF